MGRLMLSILTPAVPSRLDQLRRLMAELARQIGDLPVEHLVFMDNKRRTIGEKRDNLLRAARGDYIAFVDDDDWVSPDYVAELLAATNPPSAPRPDVVTFEQEARINDVTGRIVFGLGNENEHFKPNGIAKRNAWHVCAWRRSLAILSHFPAVNFGEDWAFAKLLCGLKDLTSAHVPSVLHFYRHDSQLTEAPLP
jgi:glycosyltransferase involved in cell wall biosynthesis